jgi:hypothetical protein
MKRILPALFLVLILVCSIVAYKSYVYITGVRTNISQTEIELEKAQIEITNQLHSLSSKNPQIRKIIDRFGSFSENSQLSPEQITMLATMLEMIQRLNLGSENNKNLAQPTQDISQILSAINGLSDLQNKLNQQTIKNTSAYSSWEKLTEQIDLLLNDTDKE